MRTHNCQHLPRCKERWEETEEEFVASWLESDRRDIFGTAHYFPRWLRRSMTDEGFWQMHVAIQLPRLRRAYQQIIAEHAGGFGQHLLFEEVLP